MPRSMISSIAQEIAKWVAKHHGVIPKSIRVPQTVVDALVEEAKWFGFNKDKECESDGLRICGIPVLVDPTLTIGKIDP